MDMEIKFTKDANANGVDVDVNMKLNRFDLADEEKTLYSDLFEKFNTITDIHKLIDKLGNIINDDNQKTDKDSDDVFTEINDILKNIGEFDSSILKDTFAFMYYRMMAAEEAVAASVVSTIRDYTLQSFTVVEKYEDPKDVTTNNEDAVVEPNTGSEE